MSRDSLTNHGIDVSASTALGTHTLMTARTQEVLAVVDVEPSEASFAHSATYGAHSVFRSPENASERVSAMGAHSISKKNFEAISLPEDLSAASQAVLTASRRKDGLGAHSVALSLETAVERVSARGAHSASEYDHVLLADVFPPAPPARKSKLRRTSLVPRASVADSQELIASIGAYGVDEIVPGDVSCPPKRSFAARVALAIPSFALAACLSVFGVGPIYAPSMAYGDEGVATPNVVQELSEQSDPDAGGGIFDSSDTTGNDNPASGEGNYLLDGESNLDSPPGSLPADEIDSSTDMHMSEDQAENPEDDSTGSFGVLEAPDSVGNAPEHAPESAEKNVDKDKAVEDKDASENDKKDTKVEKEDASNAEKPSDTDKKNTPADSKKDSENRENTSKSDSKSAQKNADDNTDKTKNPLPDAPIPSNPDGNSPVDLPQQSDSPVPQSSGDDSSKSSILLSKDSNAPPNILLASSDLLPDSGDYFIQSIYESDNENFWLGRNGYNLNLLVSPETGSNAMWSFIRVDEDGTTQYLLKIGDYYLTRSFQVGMPGYVGDVHLDTKISEQAYWTLLPFMTDNGDYAYVIFDPTKCSYLSIYYDIDTHAIDGVSCEGRVYPYEGGTYPSTEFAHWTITLATELMKEWTIVFDSNISNDPSTKSVSVSPSSTLTVGTEGFTRPGYTFEYWSTNPDGTGARYTLGQQISGAGVLAADYELKLYAQWKAIPVDITFESSVGGSIELDGSSKPVSKVVQTIDSATGSIYDSLNEILKGVTAVASKGYHFGYWLIEGTNGTVSESIRKLSTLTAEGILSLSYYKDSATGAMLYHKLTFTAVFLTNTYKIFFDTNGGKGTVPSREVSYGDTSVLVSSNGISRDKYVFKGWNTQRDGSSIFVKDAATLESLLAAGVLGESDGSTATLYAQWERVPEETVKPSDKNDGTTDADLAANDKTPGNVGPTNTTGTNSANSNTKPAASSSAQAPVIPANYSGYRGRYYGYSSEQVPTVAEELPQISTVSSESITTQKANTNFFSTPVGMALLLFAGIVAVCAVIAGAAAFVARVRRKM